MVVLYEVLSSFPWGCRDSFLSSHTRGWQSYQSYGKLTLFVQDEGRADSIEKPQESLYQESRKSNRGYRTGMLFFSSFFSYFFSSPFFSFLRCHGVVWHFYGRWRWELPWCVIFDLAICLGTGISLHGLPFIAGRWTQFVGCPFRCVFRDPLESVLFHYGLVPLPGLSGYGALVVVRNDLDPL